MRQKRKPKKLKATTAAVTMANSGEELLQLSDCFGSYFVSQMHLSPVCARTYSKIPSKPRNRTTPLGPTKDSRGELDTLDVVEKRAC